MKAAALQQALYDQLNDAALTGLLSTAYAPIVPIFTDVPQSDDSEDDAAFPYLVIGRDTITGYDTKDDIGGNAVVQVDLFWRGPSMLAMRAVQDAVDARLRRQSLTITGATHITTELESAVPTPDPDGKTTHVVMLYRVLWLA